MQTPNKYYVPGVAGAKARMNAYGTATPGMDMFRPQTAGAPATPVAGQQQAGGTPFGIYSPQQTRAAVNQSVADSYAANNAYEMRKRFSRPGMSLGISATRSMLPQLVNSRLGAADAMATIPFADTQANVKQQLAAQIAQDAEGQGWGGLGLQSQANANAYNNRQQAMGWSLFNQLMGY